MPSDYAFTRFEGGPLDGQSRVYQFGSQPPELVYCKQLSEDWVFAGVDAGDDPLVRDAFEDRLLKDDELIYLYKIKRQGNMPESFYDNPHVARGVVYEYVNALAQRERHE